MTLTEIFFALIRYTILNKPLSEKVKAVLTEKEEVYSSLFSLAKSHDLAHLICEALDKNGLLPKNEIGEKFREQRMLAVFRYEKIRYVFEEICQTLEAEGVNYIPLKGSVIRDWYPEPWWRTSCDIDILVCEADLEKACFCLKNKLGYREDIKGSHDYSFFTNENLHVEIHFDLIENISKFSSVLSKVWETSSVKTGFKYHFLMSDEIFYFYHLAHMAKHIVNGGCGFRSFIDLWILDNIIPHDKTKREEVLRQGGLLTFANAAKKLTSVWLEETEKDELSESLENFLIQGGSYGNLENRITVQHVKKGGKIRYLLSRIWIPFFELKVIYPSLEKHKWLFPFYQVRRWFRVIFKNMKSTTKKRLQTSQSITKEQRSDVAKLLQDLDL